jgi:hypothetical protein
MDDDEPSAWLPLAAASRALAVTVDALRKRIAAHEIEARKDNKGRWLVRVPEHLASAALAAASGPLADDDTLASLREENAELRVALARAEERAAHAERLAEARSEAAQRVAAAEVATARAETAAKDALIAELKALLAEARRPWWRRLIG